ncbi:MAG TPA: choice-of-anchor tandem repeat GloVer-containing protein [Thermoanaerobaculia bacterium]|jgi:uncharacterized repeat protein (TIGR03803 family)|nr:choice-of-anchor tandem repeat GloVer-containing protein [Thermoanaerobaculia bacterium]
MSRTRLIFRAALGLLPCVVLALLTPSPLSAQQYDVLHDFSPAAGNPTARLLLASDGNLYGTARNGGPLGRGCVFVVRISPGPSYDYEEIHSFSGPDGLLPYAGLIESDGSFWGTTEAGGDFGVGTVFRIDADGTLTLVHSFTGADGSMPKSPLAELPDGRLFGTTSTGGVSGLGTIYAVSTSGGFETLHHFAGPEGAGPWGGLTSIGGGVAYGATVYGGANSKGTVYRLEADGSVNAVHSFDDFTDGAHPFATLAWNGVDTLFGTTQDGGGSGNGTVFSVTTDGTFTTLHALAPGDGGYPFGGVVRSASGALFGTTSAGGSFGFGTLFRVDTDTTFTVLADFDRPGPTIPLAEPTLLADGTLAGTGSAGGAHEIGTVYAFPPGGPFAVLHSFGSFDGSIPIGGLHQHSDGLIYGTTIAGGNGAGTVFRFDLSGELEYLHLFAFDGEDGVSPFGSLVAGPGGVLFGTTLGGGTGDGGTIFTIDAAGTYSQTHSLANGEGAVFYDGLTPGSDGKLYGVTSTGPPTALRTPDGSDVDVLHTFTFQEMSGIGWRLAEGPDGNFYGTSNGGGDRGSIYRLTPDGDVTTVHEFALDGGEGEAPSEGLVTSPWGLLYGTNGVRGPSGSGTAFQVDTEGRVRVLHAFDLTDGAYPSSLNAVSGGVFFGTTMQGAYGSSGTIFQMDRYGNLTTLYVFNMNSGGVPSGTVVEATDGNLYGTTSTGGQGGFGTGVIYRFLLPVRVFSIEPSSGDPLGGTAITVTGRGYEDSLILQIGDNFGSVLGANATQITATAPPLFPGQLYDVRVENADTTSATLVEGWLTDFLDVGPADIFHPYVEKLIRHHVSAGIGGGLFGRSDPATRAQMAPLLLKGARGRAFVPPACTGVFDDVPCPGTFADWIEELSAEGITSGCQQSPGLYCPSSPVTRAQLAVFLLKARNGSDYVPPACTGVFADVPCPDGFAVDWIEDLYTSGIAAGCSAAPALYCPDDPVTRGQLAAFLVRTFALP